MLKLCLRSSIAVLSMDRSPRSAEQRPARTGKFTTGMQTDWSYFMMGWIPQKITSRDSWSNSFIEWTPFLSSNQQCQGTKGTHSTGLILSSSTTRLLRDTSCLLTVLLWSKKSIKTNFGYCLFTSLLTTLFRFIIYIQTPVKSWRGTLKSIPWLRVVTTDGEVL